jgi:type III secretion protein J
MTRFLSLRFAQQLRVLKLALLMVAGLFLAGCEKELYSGLTEKEAADMVVVLNANNIDATRRAGTGGTQAVYIDDSREAEATRILSQVGLPAKKFTTLGEVFKGGGIVNTPNEERARLMYALSQEISQSISQIDGVMSARALISLPEQDQTNGERRSPRASVYVYHSVRKDIQSVIPAIKNLVANSVDGLNYEDVAVETFAVQDVLQDASNGQPLLSVFSSAFTKILMLFGCVAALVFAARNLLGNNSKKVIPVKS